MNRRLLITLLAAIACLPAVAQELPKGFEVDTTTVVIRDKGMVNDYSMVGVNFGPTVSRLFTNPSGYSQGWLYNPWYFSLTYIKNMKMFDFLPYFGYQIGIAYGHEGYRFTENKKSHYTHTIDGYSQASYSVVEVPFMIHGHFDASHFKFMLNAGPYVGYRLGITRGGTLKGDSSIQTSFVDHDRRWDYGIYGGVGFALVFDPVEFHFNAIGHMWSWGSIYAPNSNPAPYTNYYYRFAYPFDINLTFGVYFQLSKRYGKTSAQLRKEAYDIVYGEDNGQNR